MTQYPLYSSINYRGNKKPQINKDLAEQGKEETMKKYKLYWLDGRTEIIEGYDAVDAFNRAGIGRGALSVLDYYEEVKE